MITSGFAASILLKISAAAPANDYGAAEIKTSDTGGKIWPVADAALLWFKGVTGDAIEAQAMQG